MIWLWLAAKTAHGITPIVRVVMVVGVFCVAGQWVWDGLTN